MSQYGTWVLEDADFSDTWIWSEGPAVLIGDVAHHILVITFLKIPKVTDRLCLQPHGAQGAALAVSIHSPKTSKRPFSNVSKKFEDASVLSKLLAQTSATSDLETILKNYETLRRPRCLETQSGARAKGRSFKTPPGPAQELRDMTFKRSLELENIPMEDLELDERTLNRKQYGYDTGKVVEEWLGSQ